MNALTATMVTEHRTMAQSRDIGFDLGAALTETSHAMVPLKPSAAMLASGSRAGGVSVETAWKIYLAMLNEAA
ncbi:hypothetical protein [Azospirillum halopraeferens]|uniref:hypothetical protein n=1 Tax=Azospirillum halopraeferens TaxID=34010 RepID=UPI000414895C|nr:hypothetical protein [Azospirillum halopraeferens]